MILMWLPMKNTAKLKYVIKELAEDFTSEFNANIQIKILPDQSIVFKDYIIKQDKTGYWNVFDFLHKQYINQFFLKTCALIAIKEYDHLQFGKYQQIKYLDTRYQSHYCDSVIYKHNIKHITDIDQYIIVLNKLEECQARAKEYQTQISRLFKASFV